MRAASLGFGVQGSEFRASSAPPLPDLTRVEGAGLIVQDFGVPLRVRVRVRVRVRARERVRVRVRV